jgi:hypothetical protein
MTDRYKYDVCISFAGEDRPLAEDISNKLKEAGLKVFFDDFEKFTFWGKDLYKYLFKIYYEESMFCITLFSDSYMKKAWTNHELRAAQTRMLEEKREYILPIVIDKRAYPKEFSAIAYLEVTDINHDSIAETMNNRLLEHLESTGWIEENKLFEQIMKEQNNNVFINQFIKSISKETD